MAGDGRHDEAGSSEGVQIRRERFKMKETVDEGLVMRKCMDSKECRLCFELSRKRGGREPVTAVVFSMALGARVSIRC